MTIQLPTDLEERINMRLQNATGATISDVLRNALDALDSQDQENLAIQEGLDDLENGRLISLREFDRDFRTRHNITPDA
jgi:predicted transcriptional regulator